MSEVLKYKWALMGTVGFHILMLVFFRQYRFETKFKPLELVEMPVLLDPEQLKIIPDDVNRQQLEQEDGKIENKTVNEADKRGKQSENYDSRSFSGLNDRVDADVRNLEQQFHNEFTDKHPDKGVTTNPVSHDKKDKSETDKNKNENNGSPNVNANHTATTARVSASYNLNGRRDERFVKPSYICKGSGKVVLNIKVDRNGRVQSADINSSESTFTEECMGENAKKYAYKCKFEASTQFPDPQSGTITYTFIAQ